MRPVPIAALAALAVSAFAAPASFPEHAVYTGTLRGKVKALLPGLKPQKLKPKSPDTLLDVNGPSGKFTITTLDVTLIGTMTAGAKPGQFTIVQPTGEDLDVLIAGVEQYFDTNSPVGVSVSDVSVRGLHAMKQAGAAVKSTFLLDISGTTDLFSLPFTATAKLKFKGRQPPG